MRDASNEVGIIGVILVLVAYFLLQWGKLRSDGFLYSFINLIGAVGIIYSLFFEWNLSAFVIESVWILISLYGIIRFFMGRRKTPPMKKD